MRQPASVTRMVWSQVALAVLGLLAVVLVAMLRDDLIRSWAEGREGLRQTLRQGGLAAIKASDVDPPAFVPVAIVLFVVLVSLLWVLTAFVRLGYGWSRLVITGTLVFIVIATVAGIRTSPPSVFVALAVVSFVIEAAALVQLWHRDTTAYMQGSWTAPERADASA